MKRITSYFLCYSARYWKPLKITFTCPGAKETRLQSLTHETLQISEFLHFRSTDLSRFTGGFATRAL